MELQVLNLREEPVNGFMPTMTAYLIEDNSTCSETRKLPAMIICPGGAYLECSNREAEPIALQYVAAGYCAFVLDYTVAPIARYPEPQKDAFAAIKLVREHADEWGIDEDKIAIIGFSAGGHLAASTGILWNEEPFCDYNGINKPNAVVLGYPVISSDSAIGHSGSFYSLCKDDEELKRRLSLETRVTSNMPPCFIWHTFEDELVPVQNSLRFAEALKNAGVSCELHVYPHGPHGLSLANSVTAPDERYCVKCAQEWVSLSVEWLNHLFEENA